MMPPSKTGPAKRKPYPTPQARVLLLLSQYNVYPAKKLAFWSKLCQEKSIFSHHDDWHFLSARLPFKWGQWWPFVLILAHHCIDTSYLRLVVVLKWLQQGNILPMSAISSQTPFDMAKFSQSLFDQSNESLLFGPSWCILLWQKTALRIIYVNEG